MEKVLNKEARIAELELKIKDLSWKIQFGLLSGPALEMCQDDRRAYTKELETLRKSHEPAINEDRIEAVAAIIGQIREIENQIERNNNLMDIGFNRDFLVQENTVLLEKLSTLNSELEKWRVKK